MKKILSLLVLMVAFASCEEDIQFNNPAVQGLKDNELWRAANFSAMIGGDGSLTIIADNGFETLTLRTASTDPREYELGINEQNKASFVLYLEDEGIEMSYQTGTGVGDGLIVISGNPAETNLGQGYISGTFRFNAFNGSGNVLNFADGVFYKVPVMPSN